MVLFAASEAVRGKVANAEPNERARLLGFQRQAFARLFFGFCFFRNPFTLDRAFRDRDFNDEAV